MGKDVRDEQPADAGDREDDLGHHRATEERSHLQPHDGHDRQERVPQHMTPDHHRLGEALPARGNDVFSAEDLEHARPREARDHRRDRDAERDRRKHQEAQVERGILGQRYEARGGEPAQPQAEEQDQQETEEEGRDRGPGERTDRNDAVEPRTRSGRGDDASGDADRERDEERESRQLEGHGKAVDDRAEHRLVRSDRAAEVALQHLRRPADVLDRQRLVQSEVLPDLSDRRGVRALAEHERYRISGREPQHEERPKGQEKEHRDHRHATRQEIAEHAAGRTRG